MMTNSWFKLAAVSLAGIVLSFILLWGIQQFNQYQYYNNMNNIQMNGTNMQGGNMNTQGGNMNMPGGNTNMPSGGMMMDNMPGMM